MAFGADPGFRVDPEEWWPSMSAFDEQVGGDHYRGMAIQPAEYYIRNRLGGAESAVIKYVSRWNRAGGGGIRDLEKARQTLDQLIEIERSRATAVAGHPPIEQMHTDDEVEAEDE